MTPKELIKDFYPDAVIRTVKETGFETEIKIAVVGSLDTIRVPLFWTVTEITFATREVVLVLKMSDFKRINNQ